MNTLSTHILDISTGKPAQGVAVNLLRGGQSIASGITDEKGRIASLAPGKLTAGRYRLVAETGDWFTRGGLETLYLCAQIDFAIAEEADEHFHLPFLIAPGGWSTYRGS
ncbi:5-hydroxyisourate hydrolase [Raoultella ornithinolytica]|jgi:5-hydroxyisourate hydrolase|uniref:5-hydroxyisourate hydrolase n=1 Tax=Raoultella ornithinolytica TaxID=54291 RepID=A0A1Y6GKH2_RAOOR|nr:MULTISPECIES: hydroxyisourate hydrolase [Raoultella]HDX8331657.1 hydroxyisourate hydrolase [Raoultella ornithinolytica CD1_MRS_4]AGJ86629.1 hydroxyisourate hydrolase [Raoultella ornithinolytica B6]ALQ47492.1 5-Hydroxyisourate Hydrolase (HIUase) [Raoultella ornithinolytica]ANZ05439.1 5-hydroxyisourate hydrolase [Raoultella ornithinolytica]AOO56635.1 5-hydroxyisourate hydrolase [Raoultella ornithinolytica]